MNTPLEDREELYATYLYVDSLEPQNDDEMAEIIDLKADIRRQIFKIEALFGVCDN